MHKTIHLCTGWFMYAQNNAYIQTVHTVNGQHIWGSVLKVFFSDSFRVGDWSISSTWHHHICHFWWRNKNISFMLRWGNSHQEQRHLPAMGQSSCLWPPHHSVSCWQSASFIGNRWAENLMYKVCGRIKNVRGYMHKSACTKREHGMKVCVNIICTLFTCLENVWQSLKLFWGAITN